MSDLTRVLVVGSNSFTGSHFVDYVLDHTDCRVVGASRSPEYLPAFLPYRYAGKQPHPERFRFVQLDVNEVGPIERLCQDFRPHLVVNFAAQGEVRNSWKWPLHWYQTNCLGVVRLAEALRELPELQRYVAISTPEVYGSTEPDQRESECYRPSTPYAASKLAGDLHLLALHRHAGFPVVFTRAANLYGIHQQLYRIIPRTILYARLGRQLELHGGGGGRRAFIHARDVAEATWKAATVGRPGEVYHLAPTQSPITIRELVEQICLQLGCPFEEVARPVGENFGQDATFHLNADKARRELNWTPRVRLDQGIAEMVDWIDNNLELLQSQPLDYVHKE